MLKMLEPYVVNQINSMSEMNLLSAIRGYYAFDDARYPTLVTLEEALLQNLPQISIEFVSEILYFYT